MFKIRPLQPDNSLIVDKDIFLSFSPLTTELLLEILTEQINLIRKETHLTELKKQSLKTAYKEKLSTRKEEIKQGGIY